MRWLISLALFAGVLVFVPEIGEAQQHRAADVLQVVRANMPSLRACYERALRASGPALAGRLNLEVRVRADGRVRKARIVDATMSNTPIERCIQRAFTRMRFPAANGPLVFRYPLIFQKSH